MSMLFVWACRECLCVFDLPVIYLSVESLYKTVPGSPWNRPDVWELYCEIINYSVDSM